MDEPTQSSSLSALYELREIERQRVAQEQERQQREADDRARAAAAEGAAELERSRPSVSERADGDVEALRRSLESMRADLEIAKSASVSRSGSPRRLWVALAGFSVLAAGAWVAVIAAVAGAQPAVRRPPLELAEPYQRRVAPTAPAAAPSLVAAPVAPTVAAAAPPPRAARTRRPNPGGPSGPAPHAATGDPLDCGDDPLCGWDENDGSNLAKKGAGTRRK